MTAHRRQLIIWIFTGWLCVYALAWPGPSAYAQVNSLPATACALIGDQVVCYDRLTVTAHEVSPSGRHVTDFAIDPSGEWVVYRADNLLIMASIYGTVPEQILDQAATPSDSLSLTLTTIDWSPDGIAIAYITADGLRVVYPTLSTAEGAPRYVNNPDRPYIALQFSPGGGRLAAQADDGSWTLFALAAPEDGPLGLQRLRTIDRSAELAWADDNSVVIAPLSGGLFRLDAANASLAPLWTIPDQHFTKLMRAIDGQLYASQPDPGDTVGNVVNISPDGRVAPVGNAKIDVRVQWGPPNGQIMYYITSGTPILVYPRSGGEDTLPLRRVTAMVWADPPDAAVSSIALEADLYFRGFDKDGIVQVWKLPGNGLDPVIQITHRVQDVNDFAVSPDRKQIALITGGQLLIAPLNETLPPLPPTVTPTPNRFVTPTASPTPIPDVVLAKLVGDHADLLEWNPKGQEIVFDDGAGVSLVASNGKGTPALILRKTDDIRLATSGLLWGPFPSHTLLGYETGATRILVALRVPSGERQPISSPSWDIVDARFADNDSALFLRRVGWKGGPSVMRLYSAPVSWTGQVPEASALSPARLIDSPVLSPSGLFAAGLERRDTAKMLKFDVVILDIQAGRRVIINGTNGVLPPFRWMN